MSKILYLISIYYSETPIVYCREVSRPVFLCPSHNSIFQQRLSQNMKYLAGTFLVSTSVKKITYWLIDL